jgi:hypothetical protein
MNRDVKPTVEQCTTLRLQLNKGERHRIMSSSFGRGSLWITPRLNCYCVCPTGEVKALLYNFLCSHFGSETGIDQSRKYWNISDYSDVVKVIRRFGEL